MEDNVIQNYINQDNLFHYNALSHEETSEDDNSGIPDPKNLIEKLEPFYHYLRATNNDNFTLHLDQIKALLNDHLNFK